jgi:hypothetical protein
MKRLLIAVLALAVVGPVAHAVTPVVDPELRATAAQLEALVPDHTWYGQVFGLSFDSNDPALQTRAHETGMHGQPDAALWTGAYLAAESFRYAVAKNAAATADDDAERADALAQQAQAKARVQEMVAKFHILINISKNWKHRDCSVADPPGGVHSCGVNDGEAGILWRTCFPDGVPAWQQGQGTNAGKMIFGPLHWDEPNPWNADTWWCEDGTSRDQHAGATFGLLTAFDLVAADDAALRHQIRDDVLTLSSYLWGHGWTVFKPNTFVSTSGSENFIFPLFVINPQPRLNMTQAARHVAAVDGDAVDAAKWEAIWHQELAAMGPNLATEYLLAIESPHKSYYNFNLNHLTNFNVIRLEQDPAVRAYLKATFAIIDATTRDDINAHFEAITYALTGEQDRFGLSQTHLKQWRTYRSHTDQATNHLALCGTALACMQEDAVTLHQQAPAGPIDVTIPGQSTSMRAVEPLPVVERAPEDFLWQRSPYQLNGSAHMNEREVGADFLLPYWMLRYFSEVAPPADEPMPTWLGPTAS